MPIAESAPLWGGNTEGRFFTRLDVTTMLNGAMLAVPLHVVTGARPGPTFGIVTNTHGDEFLPTIAIRQFIRRRWIPSTSTDGSSSCPSRTRWRPPASGG